MSFIDYFRKIRTVLQIFHALKAYYCELEDVRRD
jgi:hypothetical protein